MKPNISNCLLLLAAAIVVNFVDATAGLTENVLMTEVFEIPIDPQMFNWTYEGRPNQYVYQPSLQNSPDLPPWINYVYSHRHHAGYLYGVPPMKMKSDVNIEIIALNRENYETRRRLLKIHVAEKLNPAKHEVQLKIDNLNVEDMFDVERMERLKDVFRKKLWRDSQDDLYVTFLASAIELGARLPLNPKEGEGVVIRLGSRAALSTELIELQEEVKPLWKVPSCPRDFKRTTVERYFREVGFGLDWCAFRLLEDNSSAMHHSSSNVEKLSNLGEDILNIDNWQSISKQDIPQRSYVHEVVFTILVPMIIMAALALLLSFILCFHHEGISKHMEDIPEEDVNQYATIHRATHTLRSLSNTRDFNGFSGYDTMVTSRSPTSTMSRGVHCRPSPPPYIRPKNKPADF